MSGMYKQNQKEGNNKNELENKPKGFINKPEPDPYKQKGNYSNNENTELTANLSELLILVSKSGDIQQVKQLIEKGANINSTDKYGYTPLHFAAKSGNTKVAEFLIKSGSDVNAKNKDGYTPLHFAAQSGNIELAEFLIKSGSDINDKDK
ncbi:MAG: ankyrin repeat domain-containing protein, partial [Candidatus Anstonellaceae archaeon]